MLYRFDFIVLFVITHHVQIKIHTISAEKVCRLLLSTSQITGHIFYNTLTHGLIIPVRVQWDT